MNDIFTMAGIMTGNIPSDLIIKRATAYSGRGGLFNIKLAST